MVIIVKKKLTKGTCFPQPFHSSSLVIVVAANNRTLFLESISPTKSRGGQVCTCWMIPSGFITIVISSSVSYAISEEENFWEETERGMILNKRNDQEKPVDFRHLILNQFNAYRYKLQVMTTEDGHEGVWGCLKATWTKKVNKNFDGEFKKSSAVNTFGAESDGIQIVAQWFVGLRTCYMEEAKKKFQEVQELHFGLNYDEFSKTNGYYHRIIVAMLDTFLLTFCSYIDQLVYMSARVTFFTNTVFTISKAIGKSGKSWVNMAPFLSSSRFNVEMSGFSLYRGKTVRISSAPITIDITIFGPNCNPLACLWLVGKKLETTHLSEMILGPYHQLKLLQLLNGLLRDGFNLERGGAGATEIHCHWKWENDEKQERCDGYGWLLTLGKEIAFSLIQADSKKMAMSHNPCMEQFLTVCEALRNSFRKTVLLLIRFGGDYASESQDRSNRSQGGPL
ncbi:hypothetical protein L2E82_02030 [Cichorium intybus]|uniref:Uncharacterized protein n=1 Tax=Cichorium intybus TaxID=13427 RepID=A0ACB9H1C1_CICIN|nr:hypothetical protein L2E82_02030 [Cichorium intybus]